jgi:hypothetical protein
MYAMIFYVAIIGCVLGLILGGSIKDLLDIKLKLIWLILIFGLFSLLPNVSFFSEQISKLGISAAYILAILRYGSLIFFAVVNRKNISCIVIGFGGTLNMLVTLANSGKMPVSSLVLNVAPNDIHTIALKNGYVLNYIVENTKTNLSFLADNIRLPGIEVAFHSGKIINVVYYFASIGDIVISIGIFLFCFLQARPKFLINLKNNITKSH